MGRSRAGDDGGAERVLEREDRPARAAWSRGAAAGKGLAQNGQSFGRSARSFLNSGSATYFFLKVLSCLTSAACSISRTLETIPVVSSKPRLQLPRQPRIRCMTVRSLSVSRMPKRLVRVLRAHLDARALVPMAGVQRRLATADPDAFDVDRVPALGQHHAAPGPRAGIPVVDAEPGKTVEACHEEPAEICHERPDARLAGEGARELVGLHERLVDEVGVAPLEELARAGAVPDPGGVDAEHGGEHGMADEGSDAPEVELD